MTTSRGIYRESSFIFIVVVKRRITYHVYSVKTHSFRVYVYFLNMYEILWVIAHLFAGKGQDKHICVCGRTFMSVCRKYRHLTCPLLKIK